MAGWTVGERTMMATDVVLVHGGWHSATCWEQVIDGLAALGFVADAVQLPLKGYSSDIEAVRSAIRDAGGSPVVVAHSYGGAVLSEAASGTAEVSRLIYVAAFLLEPAERPADYLSPELKAGLRIDGTTLTVDPARAADIFYGDLDSQTAATMVSQLRGMSVDPPVATATPAWRAHPTTYVVCTKDRAIPPEAQRTMASRAEQVIELPTDHSPFLGRPSTVAGLIADSVVASRRH